MLLENEVELDKKGFSEINKLVGEAEKNLKDKETLTLKNGRKY